MNKKLILAITASVFSFVLIGTAKADNPPSIAILDTGIDTSLPIFKDRIVYEVCILEWSTCPNGRSFMSGTGSAVLSKKVMYKFSFSHGTAMASVVAQTDPNVKIVFVRIIGSNALGNRQFTSDQTVINALNWVVENKERFNIKSVAMSQGHHNLLPYSDYCPLSINTNNLIERLSSMGVGVFFPAGNSYDYNRIDWPACVDKSISVGAIDKTGYVAPYSNFDFNKLDLYEIGDMNVVMPGGILSRQFGTSIANQVAATKWAVLSSSKPNLTTDQLLDLIKRTSVPVKSYDNKVGTLFSLESALNG